MDVIHLHPGKEKRPKWLYFLRKLEKAKIPMPSSCDLYRGEIESLLTGNITTPWDVHGPGEEGSVVGDLTRPEHDWHPFPKHQWYQVDEVPAQNPENNKRQYPPQPQLVHPAAIWQEV